jgi:hypothetical protein
MFRVVLIIIVILISLPTYAKCRMNFVETEQAFNHSKNAILVYVRNAQQIENTKVDFKAEFEVIESFKGSFSKGDLGIGFYSSSTTSFLLTPGQSYMLYLQENNFVSKCLGSKKYIWHMDKGKLQTKLSKLRVQAL